jgi:hypothetical protein
VLGNAERWSRWMLCNFDVQEVSFERCFVVDDAVGPRGFVAFEEPR